MSSIVINQPMTGPSIVVCDGSADIVIAADLHATAGSIYVLGLNVMVEATAHLTADNGNVFVTGTEHTHNKGSLLARGIGAEARLAGGSYPVELLTGRHIGTLN